jgi:hypothetical protein
MICSGASRYHATRMRHDEIANHGESDAEAAILKRKCTLVLHEQLENVAESIGCDANASVRNGNHDRVAIRLCRQGDGADCRAGC